jgi:hypothetical protein
MGEMMVQFAGMQAAVTDMERSITRLQTAIDTLEGDLRPLVATWTGRRRCSTRSASAPGTPRSPSCGASS